MEAGAYKTKTERENSKLVSKSCRSTTVRPIQAYLGNTAGVVLGHHNKLITSTIKPVMGVSWTLSRYKAYVYTVLHTVY